MTPGARRRVLVTDGGTGQGRSALAAVRALAMGGYEPWVTRSGSHSLAASSRWCAGAVDVPPVGDRERYADAVSEARGRHDVVAVVPASDSSLLALGAPVGHLVDKAQLAASADAAGFTPAPTTTYSSGREVQDAIRQDRVALPIVVKPVVSTAPARRITTHAGAAGLEELEGSLVVQPEVTGQLRAMSAVVIGGEAVAAVSQVALRTWPVDCGTSSAAVTVAVDEDTVAKLVTLAGPFEGVIQAQWVGDHLVDVNPRVYGSLPLAVAAGANLVAIWCDVLQGIPVPTVRARPGVHYRWLEGDLRNAVARLRGGAGVGTVLREMRPRAGSAHSVESLRDPRPLIARARYALAR